jgi:hypothetical protein
MLNKIQHGTLGKGMGGFHGILRAETKTLSDGSSPAAIAEALERAYGKWGQYLEPDHRPLAEQLFLTATKWLEEEAMRP